MSEKLFVVSSPHILAPKTTQGIMRDVLIALTPAVVAGVLFFGFRTLAVLLVCVAFSMASEYVMRVVILKRSNNLGDLSAVVTGTLLALNMPPAIPLWMCAVGAVMAIVLVKELFGGLGQNFMNPALAARCILLVAYGKRMTTWTPPHFLFSTTVDAGGVDAATYATPLAALKTAGHALPGYMDLFLGNVGGSIGETSAIALLIGLAYLLARGIISWMIPTLYVGTTALMVWILGSNGLFAGDPLYHILAGGLLLGAIFMATDYTSCPLTNKGKVIFAIGCGLLTALFRLYTSMPEGVSFSIILMNVCTPLIDRYTRPVSFGGGKAQ